MAEGLDLSGRGGLAYLMRLLQGGMWAPQQQAGGGGGAQAPVEAGGGAPAAPAAVPGGAEGGGSPEDAQTALLRGLVETYSRTQPTVEEAYAAKAKARNPVQFARQQQEASLANPFGPGGYFEGRPKLTPEAAIASQGNNAVNQWAQLGGVTQGGAKIDPEELKRLNEQTRLSRRTYV